MWMALSLLACADDDVCAGTDHAGEPVCSAWQVNTLRSTAAVLGSGILTDVESVQVVTDDGRDYLLVQSSGIPSYSTTLTSEQLAALQARPLAATDFVTGEPTVAAGDVVAFGADVGYRSDSPDDPCTVGAGYGYWPPGPGCPSDQAHALYFPLDPAPVAEGTECETGLGTAGLWLNGVSIYNWSDGMAYDNQRVWQNIAPMLEAYDGDLCGGHAAGGDYHHHSDASCLGEQLGDDGTGHSPMYGVANDGYALYGPWFAEGVPAESCWIARDYDDPSDATGCGGTGERSCVLVDPTDPGQGTETTGSPGPDTSETITSLSGNSFSAALGLYQADYWYDASCAARGGQYLDEHNGHYHDALGYHYHLTASYPFTLGPTLYGELHDNADVSCGGIQAGPG